MSSDHIPSATLADIKRVQDTRKRLIATIQIARKSLALDDGTYRSLLVRIANQDSCTLCTEAALHAVVAEFKRLGFQPSGKRPAARSAHVRKVYGMWGGMERLLSDPSLIALRTFVKRQTGVSSPEWLDGAQATKVIEGLKAWKERLEKGAGQ